MTLDLKRLRELIEHSPRGLLVKEVFRGGEYQGTDIDRRCMNFYDEARTALPAAIDEIEALRAEVAGLKATLDEREHDMHMRIRAGYDQVVANAWRMKVAEVKAALKEAVLIGQTALSDEGHDHDECEHWARLAQLAKEAE